MYQIVVALKGIILHNGKVLIIQRAKDDEVGGGTWENPGGKLDFGEDLEEALKREIHEETGLDVKVEKLLYATTFLTNPARQVVIINYLCKTKENHIVLSLEHSQYYWADIYELKNMLPKNIIEDYEKNHVFNTIFY